MSSTAGEPTLWDLYVSRESVKLEVANLTVRYNDLLARWPKVEQAKAAYELALREFQADAYTPDGYGLGIVLMSAEDHVKYLDEIIEAELAKSS